MIWGPPWPTKRWTMNNRTLKKGQLIWSSAGSIDSSSRPENKGIGWLAALQLSTSVFHFQDKMMNTQCYFFNVFHLEVIYKESIMLYCVGYFKINELVFRACEAIIFWSHWEKVWKCLLILTYPTTHHMPKRIKASFLNSATSIRETSNKSYRSIQGMCERSNIFVTVAAVASRRCASAKGRY